MEWCVWIFIGFFKVFFVNIIFGSELMKVKYILRFWFGYNLFFFFCKIENFFVIFVYKFYFY